jgi:hypothetical protein
MQGQIKGSDFIQWLLYNLQKHNLQFMGLLLVIYFVSRIIGSASGMVSHIHKRVHEYGVQNELMLV